MNTDRVREKVVKYLLGVITGDVRELQQERLSPSKAARITGYDKNGTAIPADKLKAAEILLKYLNEEEGNGDSNGVIIVGEGSIKE